MPAPDSFLCAACGWRGQEHDGVEVRLRRNHLENEVAARYFANYEGIAELDLDSPIQELRYVENCATKMMQLVGSVRGLEVCDLGCGRGILTRRLCESEAATVTAVDISAAYLKVLAGSPRVRAILADAENLPFRDAFDVIVSTDVMEHVLNVGSFLYCVNRALKPGGRTYIRVPYREDLMPYSPHVGCKHQFVHLRTYNRALLKDALRAAGFKVEGFRLDGQFVGRPRRVWTSHPLLYQTYFRFVRYVERRGNPADAMMMPKWLTFPFMPPVSAVVAARKVSTIKVSTGGGFTLERLQ